MFEDVNAQGQVISRRKLMQGIGAAAVATGTAQFAWGSPNGQGVTMPPAEHCSIYELLTLWLIFSTNPALLHANDATIGSATGLSSTLIMNARALYSANQPKFQAATDAYALLVSLYQNYSPGQCPVSVST